MIEVGPVRLIADDPIYKVLPAHLELLTAKGFAYEVIRQRRGKDKRSHGTANLEVSISTCRWITTMVRSRIVAAADHNTAHKSDAQVADTASKLLGEADPDVLFVHFDDVDHAGHAHGVHPEQMKYIQAIESVDAHVGRLLKTLHERKTRPLEDWLIVGSTDHGGSGKSHGRDIPEHRTIFLIVSGNSAARGTIDPPPTIVDVAPTVIKHLSIPIDPAWKLDGKPVGLK